MVTFRKTVNASTILLKFGLIFIWLGQPPSGYALDLNRTLAEQLPRGVFQPTDPQLCQNLQANWATILAELRAQHEACLSADHGTVGGQNPSHKDGAVRNNRPKGGEEGSVGSQIGRVDQPGSSVHGRAQRRERDIGGPERLPDTQGLRRQDLGPANQTAAKGSCSVPACQKLHDWVYGGDLTDFKNSQVNKCRSDVADYQDRQRDKMASAGHSQTGKYGGGTKTLPLKNSVPYGNHQPWGNYQSSETVETRAVLAADVYKLQEAYKIKTWDGKEEWVIRDENGQDVSYNLPDGMKKLVAVKHEPDGFLAAAFEDDQGKIIIAYAGTQRGDEHDLRADRQIVRDTPGFSGLLKHVVESGGDSEQLDSQIDHALDFFREVRQVSGASTIQVTGHSLGGHHAQIVGALYGVETHTFNAPGVSPKNLEKYVGTIRTSLRITNHIREHDVVGNFGNHIGGTVTWPDSQVYSAEDNKRGGSYWGPQMPDQMTKKYNALTRLLDNHYIRPWNEDFQSRGTMSPRISTDRSLQEDQADNAARRARRVPKKDLRDLLKLDRLLKDAPPR